MRLFGLVLVSVLASACAADLEDDPSVTHQAIVGGSFTSGDPAVGALLATYSDGSQTLCTGTLISSDVVLTAAHCLNGQRPESRVVFFGSDLSQSQQDSGFIDEIDVIDSVYDVGFDLNNLEAGHDIGMVRLARSPNIAPLPLNQTSTTSLIGQPLRLVGFGRTVGIDSGGNGGAGIKRETMSSLRSFADAFQVSTNPPDLLAYGSSEENTCMGDSGGPSFISIDGVEYVAGVTSFGDRNCISAGASTRVDRYLDFISAYVGNAASTCADDGICESSCASPDPDCAADQCGGDGVCDTACGARDPDCSSSAEESAGVVGGCNANGRQSLADLSVLMLLALGLFARRRRQKRVSRSSRTYSR